MEFSKDKTPAFLQKWLPMSETSFYMLLALRTPRHGYAIAKYAEELTCGRIKLGSGTIYGTLQKLKDDSLICVYDDSSNRITYELTSRGKILLEKEIERLRTVVNDVETALAQNG